MNVEKHGEFRIAGKKAGKKDKNGSGKKPEKMSRKDYEEELEKLQVELCHLQDWVRETGARIIIAFEGRDTAGKGGLIRRLTERVSPRTFRIVALSASARSCSSSATSSISRLPAKS